MKADIIEGEKCTTFIVKSLFFNLQCFLLELKETHDDEDEPT